MKKTWADLSRIEEVRDSARGWRAAGAIDALTLAAIEAAYPDPRLRLHGFWRVLIFVLVSVVVNALVFFTMPASGRFFGVSLVFGLLLAGATETLRGSRYSGTGADAATSFWAVAYLLAAVADLLFRQRSMPVERAITAMLAAILVVGALSARRWGFWLYAACAAGAGYVLLGRLPSARLLWVGVSTAAMWLLRRELDTARLPPNLRRCAAAWFAVSASALYAAVNLFSVDHYLIEMIRGFGPDFRGTEPTPTRASRLLAGIATALLPIVYLAWGVRARRRLLMGLGLVSAALSVATWRYYVRIAPLWMVLAVCGAVLIAAAIAIQRALRSRPAGEWRGLTAEPLYELDRDGISPLAAIAAHAASGGPAPERHGLETGGGEYGGGGATGRY